MEASFRDVPSSRSIPGRDPNTVASSRNRIDHVPTPLRDRDRAGRGLGHFLLLLVTLMALSVLSVGPALAHGGEDIDEAKVLVRQAIALIVSTPDDVGEIREKVTAALDAPDTSGVDLTIVQEADAALANGDDVAQVRGLLERSIGAGPVGGPAPDEPAPSQAGSTPSAQAAPSQSDTTTSEAEPAPSQASTATQAEGGGEMDDEMATGADPGSTLVAAPLDTRPQLDATDWVLLAGSILAGLVGVWLVLRFRPATGVSKADR